MRYLLVLPVLMLVAGCATTDTTHIEAKTEVARFHSHPYSDEDFLVTPGAYDADYDAVGFVTVTAWPEADLVEEIDSTFLEESKRMWKVATVDTQGVVADACDRAAELGADALTHFEIRPVRKTIAGTEFAGIEAVGFAIRRR